MTDAELGAAVRQWLRDRDDALMEQCRVTASVPCGLLDDLPMTELPPGAVYRYEPTTELPPLENT